MGPWQVWHFTFAATTWARWEKHVSGQPPDAPPGNLPALFPERLELLLLDALGLAAVAGEAFLGRGPTGDGALRRLVVTGGALELGILEIQVCLVRKRDRLEDRGLARQQPTTEAAGGREGHDHHGRPEAHRVPPAMPTSEQLLCRASDANALRSVQHLTLFPHGDGGDWVSRSPARGMIVPTRQLALSVSHVGGKRPRKGDFMSPQSRRILTLMLAVLATPLASEALWNPVA